MEIGDDIVLRLDHNPFESGILHVTYRYPGRRPSRWGGVRRWRAAAGALFVEIEARPGPCTTRGGMVYDDNVTVRRRGQTLTGCGGRVLTGRRG